jgi:hypothetical protein
LWADPLRLEPSKSIYLHWADVTISSLSFSWWWRCHEGPNKNKGVEAMLITVSYYLKRNHLTSISFISPSLRLEHGELVTQLWPHRWRTQFWQSKDGWILGGWAAPTGQSLLTWTLPSWLLGDKKQFSTLFKSLHCWISILAD